MALDGNACERCQRRELIVRMLPVISLNYTNTHYSVTNHCLATSAKPPTQHARCILLSQGPRPLTNVVATCGLLLVSLCAKICFAIPPYLLRLSSPPLCYRCSRRQPAKAIPSLMSPFSPLPIWGSAPTRWCPTYKARAHTVHAKRA